MSLQNHGECREPGCSRTRFQMAAAMMIGVVATQPLRGTFEFERWCAVTNDEQHRTAARRYDGWNDEAATGCRRWSALMPYGHSKDAASDRSSARGSWRCGAARPATRPGPGLITYGDERGEHHAGERTAWRYAASLKSRAGVAPPAHEDHCCDPSDGARLDRAAAAPGRSAGASVEEHHGDDETAGAASAYGSQRLRKTVRFHQAGRRPPSYPRVAAELRDDRPTSPPSSSQSLAWPSSLPAKTFPHLLTRWRSRTVCQLGAPQPSWWARLPLSALSGAGRGLQRRALGVPMQPGRGPPAA